MYRAKDDGGNAYHFYTTEMTAAAFEHLFIERCFADSLAGETLSTALDQTPRASESCQAEPSDPPVGRVDTRSAVHRPAQRLEAACGLS